MPEDKIKKPQELKIRALKPAYFTKQVHKYMGKYYKGNN